MISYLDSDGAVFSSPLEITSNSLQSDNWITVFIAENGGRKSLLLRCLTEAGLGNYRVPVGKRSLRIGKLSETPSRVIAISGTPLDRFPRAGTRDLRSRKRSKAYGSERFVYLGQRAMNGMAGVSQSERSLVGSLFTRRSLLKKRESLLKTVFSTLGLEPIVYVFLKAVSSNLRENRNIRQAFDKFVKDSSPEEKVAAGLKTTGFNSLGFFDNLMLQAESLSPNAAAIVITTDRVRFRQKATVANFDLLIKIGAIEIVKTKFKKTEEFGSAMVQGEDLSSGQWNWLSSFSGLCMELENNSLVLVDEPENSLHPNWQRAYVPELQRCIQVFSNCQVVVATHSPLIASAVAPEWGEIRTLKRSSGEFAASVSIPLPTAYGWSATDVYDELFGMVSTRAPGFVATANLALEHIAASNVLPEDAKQWSDELNLAIPTLPELDPLRQIFADIISKLKDPHSQRSRRNSK